MNEVIEGWRVKVEPEEDAENPMREWEMVTDVVTWLRGYDFDSTKTKLYNGPVEVKKALERADLVFAAPLYSYIHSGITVHMGKMNPLWPDQEWDCGLAGFIYVTREKAKKEWPKLSGRTLELACQKRAKQDVETLDQWLRGDVWVYDVIDPDGEHVDSLGWIYGYDEACKMAMEAFEQARKECEELMQVRSSRERQLFNQAAEIRKLQAEVMDLESDLSDIVQEAEKGDVVKLERAIADAKALLLASGWAVCRDCREVYWPPDWGRTKEDGCPTCEEVEPNGYCKTSTQEQDF